MDTISTIPTHCHNDDVFQSVFTKKRYSLVTQEEHLNKCDEYLKDESMVDFCLSRGVNGKCTCLHILRQAPLRQRVAQYLVEMSRSPDFPRIQDEKKSIILKWYKQAVANWKESKSSGKILYPIPFYSKDINVHENDGAYHHTLGIINDLKTAKYASKECVR